MSSLDKLSETDFMEQLNEAMRKIELEAKAIRKARMDEQTSVNSDHTDEFRHLAMMLGSPEEVEDAVTKFNKEFGNVRSKQIDTTASLLIFANEFDARHAIRAERSSKKSSALNLYGTDDPEFDNLDFVHANADSLKPIETEPRPATNMCVIRSIVSRSLNVKVSSAKHLEEKEQLKQARESKKKAVC